MADKLPASRFDSKIVFERRGAAKDGYGAKTADWAPIAWTWAKYLPGSGTERRTAAQETSVHTAKFVTRATRLTSAVTEQERIVFEGEAWDIKSNVPLGRDRREITGVRQR
jgi:SPP1 family predicted phage head-tail adaptor